MPHSSSNCSTIRRSFAISATKAFAISTTRGIDVVAQHPRRQSPAAQRRRPIGQKPPERGDHGYCEQCVSEGSLDGGFHDFVFWFCFLVCVDSRMCSRPNEKELSYRWRERLSNFTFLLSSSAARHGSSRVVFARASASATWRRPSQRLSKHQSAASGAATKLIPVNPRPNQVSNG